MSEKLNPWHVFADLSATKVHMVDETNADEYLPFIINKAFSNFLDTVFDAAWMNCNPQMPNLAQYEYYFHTVKKRKRYHPWIKLEPPTKELLAVSAYYDYNLDRAKEVIALLKPEQLEVIMKHSESLKQINTS